MNYQTVIKEIKEALKGQNVDVIYVKTTKHIVITRPTNNGSISFPISQFINTGKRGCLYQINLKHGTIWNFRNSGNLDADWS